MWLNSETAYSLPLHSATVAGQLKIGAACSDPNAITSRAKQENRIFPQAIMA
jgi:hypothetical protein